MSKEKTIVTGDLVAADWVSNKPKPASKMMTQEEIQAAAAKAKKKKQKK